MSQCTSQQGRRLLCVEPSIGHGALVLLIDLDGYLVTVHSGYCVEAAHGIPVVHIESLYQPVAVKLLVAAIDRDRLSAAYQRRSAIQCLDALRPIQLAASLQVTIGKRDAISSWRT